jgi:teichoic acid transport system permease protein
VREPIIDLAVIILVRTPWWVWLILFVTVLFGVWSLRPHAITPRRLAILPLTAAVLSLWNAGPGSIHPAQTIALWAACAVVGGVVGVLWTQSMQVSIDRVQAKIHLPGTSGWLVVGMLFFVTRYALGVFLAFHRQPDFDLLRALAPAAIGGFAGGLALGWLGGLLWRYHAASARVTTP